MRKVGIWKALLILCALARTTQFCLHEYIRQSALQEVIIAAYRELAIAACRHSASAKINPTVWAQTSEVRLAIGKADLDVNIWETDHRLWDARYRNAYIYITIDKPSSQIHCEYDITNSFAMVYQLGARNNIGSTSNKEGDEASRM